MKSTTVALVVFTLMTSVANAQTFPNGSVVANSVVTDTGSEHIPVFGPATTRVIEGRLLPANGNETIVETANSLPPSTQTRMASAAQTYLATRPTYLTQGTLMPTNGAEGIVQSVNSLPPGY